MLAAASASCLLPPDPGAPGETRTHNTLLKRQVPLSNLATDANHFRLPIADFQLVRVLAGLTRLELAISASTVQRFDPTKLQPRHQAIATATNRQLAIGNQQCFGWVEGI